MKEYLSPDVTVDVHSTLKNNGTIRTGLMFIQEDVNTFPTIYLEEFYEQYLQGESMNTLVQSIQEIYEKVKVKQSFPYNKILEYSKMKDCIVYKVIRRESNKKLLEQVPHDCYLDLAIVYYALMETSEFGTATRRIGQQTFLHILCNAGERRAVFTEALPTLVEKFAAVIGNAVSAAVAVDFLNEFIK